MSRRVEVSFVIPVYNQGEFLDESLGSILGQNFSGATEIIIINDGSNEKKTLEILRHLERNPPTKSFKILTQKNLGLPAARNRGVELARGKWVVPLDADDRLSPNFLKETIEFAHQKNLDFVATFLTEFGASNQKIETSANFFDQLFDNRLPCTALFSERIFAREKYDESFKNGFEDWEFWIGVLDPTKNFRGEVLPKYLFFYRRKKSSMLEKTHLNRAEIIGQIRKKHSKFYKKKFLISAKKEFGATRKVNVCLHEIHFQVGKIFPKIAFWLQEIFYFFKKFRQKIQSKKKLIPQIFWRRK